MVWNSELDRYKDFGERSLKENQNHCCKHLKNLKLDQIFDILYLNGNDLTNLSLFERRRHIQKIVTPKGYQRLIKKVEHYLEVTEQIKVKSEEHIL
jgi:hypothetical protein